MPQQLTTCLFFLHFDLKNKQTNNNNNKTDACELYYIRQAAQNEIIYN